MFVAAPSAPLLTEARARFGKTPVRDTGWSWNSRGGRRPRARSDSKIGATGGLNSTCPRAVSRGGGDVGWLELGNGFQVAVVPETDYRDDATVATKASSKQGKSLYDR